MMTKTPLPLLPHEMLFLTSIINVSIIHAQSNRLHRDCVSFSDRQLQITFSDSVSDSELIQTYTQLPCLMGEILFLFCLSVFLIDSESLLRMAESPGLALQA